MNTSRRELLLAALGAGTTTLLAGCKFTPPTGQSVAGVRPGPDFGRTSSAVKAPPPNVMPGRQATVQKQTEVIHPPGETTLAIAGLNILPRSAWTSVLGPVRHDINPLGQVKHITVHHEGWPGHAVTFTDKATTIDRLEGILRAHTTSTHNWADIGYHFIIDRAGRIWEGRNLKYQGAHVSKCNENNLGIMCLGNFDEQSPSQAQLDSLVAALKAFKSHYSVPMGEIFTHQEWKKRCPTTSTACPGRSLQAQMRHIRTPARIG